MKVPSSPLIVAFQITQKCNCSCVYCYNANLSCRDDMSLASFKRILSDFSDMGVFCFVIEGGEPLLHPFFFDFAQCIEEINVSYTIITNGILVDDLIALKLSQLSAEIIVSLDAVAPSVHNEVRGFHDAVTNGIRALITHRADISINTVITRHNIDQCHKIIDEFYPSVTKFRFLRLIPRLQEDLVIKDLLRYSKTQIRELEFRLQNYFKHFKNIRIESPFDFSNAKTIEFKESLNVPGCLAGTTLVTVRPNLDVLPCSYCQNTIQGNLGKDSFSNIWDSDLANRIRTFSDLPCVTCNSL